MSDVHITRGDFWAVNEDCPIRADEWLEFVASDGELEPQPQFGTFFCAWNSPEAGPEGASLEWNAGNVTTKSPTRATVGKLLQIAKKLGANVQNDDGDKFETLADFDSKAGG